MPKYAQIPTGICRLFLAFVSVYLPSQDKNGLIFMALYLISYDLVKSKDYQKLYDELKKFNAIKLLESEWCFRRTGTNCTNLRDYFRQFIDSDDRLLVVDMTSDWAGRNLLGDPNKV